MRTKPVIPHKIGKQFPICVVIAPDSTPRTQGCLCWYCAHDSKSSKRPLNTWDHGLFIMENNNRFAVERRGAIFYVIAKCIEFRFTQMLYPWNWTQIDAAACNFLAIRTTLKSEDHSCCCSQWRVVTSLLPTYMILFMEPPQQVAIMYKLYFVFHRRTEAILILECYI